MKSLILITTLVWSTNLFAQNLDSLGLNDSPYLNKDEVKLLNSLLEKQREDFDFSNKKVAFLIGSTGRAVVKKSEYFESYAKPWLEDGKSPQIFMSLLTDEEKKASGDYDVFVLSWVKMFSPRGKRKVIEYLGTLSK